MNVLIKLSDDIPFRNDFDFTELHRDPQIVLGLAEYLGGEHDCNVVICANTGGFSREEPYFVLLDSGHFEGCLKENEWDVFISYSDPTMAVHRHPLLKSRIRIEWADWYRCQADITSVPKDVAIVAMSDFHARLITEENPLVNPVYVVRPPVMIPDVPHMDRDSLTFFYPAKALAGLHNLRDIWEHILAEEPDAVLKVPQPSEAYAEMVKYSHFADGERARKILELLKMPGISYVPDSIGYEGFLEEVVSSSCIIYPCQPIQPYELSGCCVANALALGVPVVCSDYDCLPEFSGEGMAISLPVDTKGSELAKLWSVMCLGATKSFVSEKSKIVDGHSLLNFNEGWMEVIYTELDNGDAGDKEHEG